VKLYLCKLDGLVKFEDFRNSEMKPIFIFFNFRGDWAWNTMWYLMHV